MISHANQGRKRWTLVVAIGGLSALIVAVLLLRRGGEPPGKSADASPESTELSEVWTRPLEVEVGPVSKRETFLTDRELMPAEVIDNPDCRMRMGSGAASGLAVVVVPSANGAPFSVLDETGAVNTGALPFLPNHYKLGKRAEGSIVAGFGDLRLNQKGNRGKETPEPVRIYLDGQIIYEHDKIWQFGIANDGSSYWVVEPLGGRRSRSVIRNLDKGTERHHDLGDIYASDGYDVPYRAFYTPDNNELHLRPGNVNYPEGAGTHYFFATGGGGKSRKVHIKEMGPFDKAYLVSSEEGYFFSTGDEADPGYQVEKRRFDWTTGETETVWSQTGPSGVTTGGTVQITRDGAWLLFETAPASPPVRARPMRDSDWTLYVLNASTGEPAFVFPRVDKKAQLTRLANVLEPGATVEDVGSFAQTFINNDQLLVRRVFRTPGNIDESRGAYDVFNMNTITLYGQPDFRVPTNRWLKNLCASESFPGKLQAQEDGKLAYIAVP